MKVLLFFIILVLCFNSVAAQDKSQILKLDADSFKELIDKNPTFVGNDLWRFLYEQAEQHYENEDYQSALLTSEKAGILADRFDDLLIVYKSYRQLAKIEIMLSHNSRAAELIQKAFDSFQAGQKRIAPAKVELETEDGYLYYYWALIYSSPDHINPKLDHAFKYLALSLAFNSYYTDKKFDDPYVATSIHIARCFGMKGNHVAKILWLENAKLRLSRASKRSDKLRFQITYELQDAYQNLGDYPAAEKELGNLQRLAGGSAKSNLLYLRAQADFNSGISNRKKQGEFFDQGIELAKKVNDRKQLAEFYAGQMLRLLNKRRFDQAGDYLKLLQKMETGTVNRLDLLIAEAVLAARRGEIETSNELLTKAEDVWAKTGKDWRNEIFLRSWQCEILYLQKGYEKLETITARYLEIVQENGFLDYLPEVYVYRAKAYLGLKDYGRARETVNRVIELLELKRKSESAHISTGIIEGAFGAYQLKTDLDLAENKMEDAFGSSENLKARWLADKIAGNPLNQKVYIDPRLKSEIFELSLQILKNPADEKLFAKLTDLESKAIVFQSKQPNNGGSDNMNPNLVFELEKSSLDEQTAIVSYSFTSDGRLFGYVWQKGRKLKVVQLPIEKDQVDRLAKEVPEKIRGLIFFKNEGREIYDKLLKPFGLDARHLIIVPDNSLWKIPFQALSPDGASYLAESKLISYTPSVSILLNQIRNHVPRRASFQVFSNSRNKDLFLKYADLEANTLASLFAVQANLNSTIGRFVAHSKDADIVHFSMHSEVDNDEAFNSYLAFRPSGDDDGRLTVDGLLRINLKKGSLVFLASCDTNRVLSGEGVVSLAWGMMAVGASSVISAQWEANDESTMRYSNLFYRNYKQASSVSEAIQKTSIEMIRNKSGNMHEPYYWANFSLYGDFR